MELEDFKSKLLAFDQTQINRFTDACNWYVDNCMVFHERSYWPWSPFKESSVHYWSETVYTDIEMAKDAAKRFGAVIEKCFYCSEEQPMWFLIFDDFDKASEHALIHFNLGNFELSVPGPSAEYKPHPPRFAHNNHKFSHE